LLLLLTLLLLLLILLLLLLILLLLILLLGSKGVHQLATLLKIASRALFKLLEFCIVHEHAAVGWCWILKASVTPPQKNQLEATVKVERVHLPFLHPVPCTRPTRLLRTQRPATECFGQALHVCV